VSLKTAENNYQYNSSLPALQVGGVYEWQVSAYAGSFYLGKSQTWRFKIENSQKRSEEEGEDSTEEVAVQDTDSYRIIGDETYGADYVARGILKVAYKNVALDSLFNYNISPINTPEQYFDSLPVKVITSGLNKLSLDLASTAQFENEKYYTLEIEDGNGKYYYLNFLYLAP